MATKGNICLAVILAFALTACKVGDDDPWISLRSRDKRFIGYWDFGYKMNDSDVLHMKWDIRKDGTVYRSDYHDSFIFWGNWAWLGADKNQDRKECFTVEDNSHIVYKFTILRLTHKEIKVFYYLNNNSTQFNTYFNRIEK